MSLLFAPEDRLEVAEGSTADLSGALLAGFPPEIDAVALHVLGADAWYVVAVAELASLQELLEQGADAETIFEAPEVQFAAPEYGRPPAQPPAAAVLIEGDAVVGAWYDVGGDIDPGLMFDVNTDDFDVGPGPVVVTGNGDGAAVTAGEPVIKRTPHMDAPAVLPEAGGHFDIRVYTDTAPMNAEEEGEGIVVEAPPEVDRIELGVMLTTSPGLEVVGPFYKPLVIHRDEADHSALTFSVAVGEDALEGETGMIAQFVHRGRPSGRVARRWANGKALALGDTTAGASVHVDAAAPDLTVIVSAPVDDGINFECTVLAPKVPGFEQPRKAALALPARAQDFLKQKFAGFVDRTKPPEERHSELVSAGLQLFGATPKVFQDAVWALIDARTGGRPESGPPAIFIASDEPLLPWELMIPTRQKDGVADDRPLPLGVEFAVGRWIRSDTTPPPQRLVVDDSFLLAATNKNKDRELDSSRERDVLERLYGGKAVTPVTRTDLDTYLRENSATLLHFVCHGSAEAFDDALFLDDDERCTSGQLRIAPGFKSACALRRPLVFLNACDAGKMAPAVGGGAGFPRVFTDLGARGVVAPLWPVAQTIAAEVAVRLYEGATAQPERTIADLLRDVRLRAYEGDVTKFEDSWASYCFFGDPCMRLERRAAP